MTSQKVFTKLKNIGNNIYIVYIIVIQKRNLVPTFLSLLNGKKGKHMHNIPTALINVHKIDCIDHIFDIKMHYIIRKQYFFYIH